MIYLEEVVTVKDCSLEVESRKQSRKQNIAVGVKEALHLRRDEGLNSRKVIRC